MRRSDAELAEALRKAGLHALAARAEGGEFNDFFGAHALPKNALVREVNEVIAKEICRKCRGDMEALVDRVINGDFDAEGDESAEWLRSPEGEAAFANLTKEIA